MPFAPIHTPQDAALTLPHTLRGPGTIDAPTVGLTGRVWKLPFSVEPGVEPHHVRFSGPLEFDTALATCQFLHTHLPKLFEEWRDSFTAARLQDNPHQGVPFTTRALFETHRKRELTAPPSSDRVELPRSVQLPEIGEDHWYRRRHQNVGNYIAVSKDPIRDSKIEFDQDYSSLKFYLSKYDTLARTYSGEALFEATTWAAFRDPYLSCMQMCLFDLHLPSSFMALVNHGIGAQLAIGQRFSAWNPWYLSEQDEPLLMTTREIFKGLTRLFVEDFPSDPS